MVLSTLSFPVTFTGMKKTTLALLLSLPLLSFSQSISWGDSAYKSIVKNECEGKTFTRTEQLPALSIPEAAFADTLKAYLGSNSFSSNGQATYSFLLTKTGQLIDLNIISGNRDSTATAIYRAINHFSHFWLPAVQNSYKVCSYTKCEVKWKDGNINIRIFQ
jgi:hypothetical protein